MLTQGIGNYDSLVAKIQARLDVMHWPRELSTADLVMHSSQHLVDQRALHCLRALSHNGKLTSLGVEYKLLESPVGKKPSADILAAFTEGCCLAIIEVKISAATARQSVTEVSAYAHGISAKFWGAGSFDAVWIIVGTDFRSTVTAAIAHQMIFSNQCIIPIKATIQCSGPGKISDVQLEIQDVVVPNDRHVYENIFSYNSVVPMTVCSDADLSNGERSAHFITHHFASKGAHGLFFFIPPSPEWARAAPNPYMFFACTLNPFSITLKARILEHLSAHSGPLSDEDRLHIIREEAFDFVDVDLRTGAIVAYDHDAEGNLIGEKLDYDHSLHHLSSMEPNSAVEATGRILDELRDLSAPDAMYELSTMPFEQALGVFQYRKAMRYGDISNIYYFGFMHDLMMCVARYYQHGNEKYADKTLYAIYSSMDLLLDWLEACNGKRIEQLEG